MRILLIIIAIGCWANASASDVVKWNKGVLVTAGGEVRQGELAFQISDLVLFKTAGEVTVFPAHKVHSFRYYDLEENINRKFVSRNSPFDSHSVFYEVVVVGKAEVMRKLKSGIVSNQKNSDKDGYDYFVFFENNLVRLNQFRNRVYPELITSSSQMATLIKEHHLNPNSKADTIQIIQLYNKATSAETLLAGI